MLSSGCVKQLLTRRNAIQFAISGLLTRSARANPTQPDLARSIPARSPQALTGSQFAEFVRNTERHERERAILGQLLQGNLPGFLRRLAPVNVKWRSLTATIFVMPEYLAIGSEADFLRIPMNLHTAVAVAKRFGFLLPTRKMVDAIYTQSSCQFTPQPLPAGPRMTSTDYYTTHNAMIDTQSENRDFPSDVLVAGHKKDVVLTNRLLRNPGRIAIYGWHRGAGDPIQPLSTVHGAGYADYSHGIRLIAAKAWMDGKLRSVCDILKDSAIAAILSDEGPMHVAPILAHAQLT